jgi:hypothetical protein
MCRRIYLLLLLLISRKLTFENCLQVPYVPYMMEWEEDT